MDLADTPEPADPAALQWLLAFTKPRGEKVALENLERQGFQCFCPWFSAQKRRRGKWLWIEEPLFPRYVFVGATAEQSWSPIRSTVGVSALVRFGGQIATVPETLIAQLQSAGEHRGQQVFFKQGQSVLIVGDSFSGIEGVFQMSEGEERAQVLITLLGRPTTVKVQMANLVGR